MASEENPVVKSALEILPLYGIEAWRNQAIRVPGRKFNGKKGVADVLGVAGNGRFVAVECKKPGAKASDEQTEFLGMVKQRGGLALCVDNAQAIYYELARATKLGLI
jgi:hypothetical protein